MKTGVPSFSMDKVIDKIIPLLPQTLKKPLRRMVNCLIQSPYVLPIPKLINNFRFINSENICFLWVPKTGGTSIYNWLNNELGMLKLKTVLAVKGGFPQHGPVTFGHMRYKDLVLQNLVSQKYDNNAFKLAFVRNPYDRAVSLYYYLQESGEIEKGITFRNFTSKLNSIEPIGLYNVKGLNQCNPQVDWLIDEDGQPIFDYVGKLENFEEEINTLSAKLCIQPIIFHSRKSKRAEILGEIYSDKTAMNRVFEFYQQDFEYFNYSTFI